MRNELILKCLPNETLESGSVAAILQTKDFESYQDKHHHQLQGATKKSVITHVQQKIGKKIPVPVLIQLEAYLQLDDLEPSYYIKTRVKQISTIETIKVSADYLLAFSLSLEMCSSSNSSALSTSRTSAIVGTYFFLHEQ